MSKKVQFLLCSIALMIGHLAFAQVKTITGTVKDGAGVPLPGVSVLIESTSKGVATDFDGNYSIEAKQGDVLVFSYVGFTSVKKVVGGGKSLIINVLLKEDTQQLGEVVVTALGIKREKKSLGYALQEIKGDELVESRETNLSNAFSGKVAGLQIVKGSNGPGSSSKIVLRGNNSLTGDNQPLVVVDGVPMDNFTGASNNDFWNPSADMGNGLGDLNPNDIESMSVLKGPAAAALYGSRAGNGVILITTKKGKSKEGLGITYSTSVGFEDVFMLPETQNIFGQGSNGVYEATSTSSWGPKIDGQTVTNWKGDSETLKSYDNVNNYLNTGVNIQHNLSFQQQITNGTSLYSSLTYATNESSIPGATLDRMNFITRSVSNFGKDKRWTTDIKVQYINTEANNRPLGGNRSINSLGSLISLPSTMDITKFREATDKDGNQVWYNSSGINPYWLSKYNLNKDSRDRFLMNGSIKYNVTDWLNAEVKAGTDMYTTNTETKTYARSPLTPTGRYSLGKNTFNETNLSFLLSADKRNLFGKVGMSATFGGNLMYRKHSGVSAHEFELVVPDLFSTGNAKDKISVGQPFSEHKINSLYGTYQISYDEFLFLDLTGRNDWSSALSKENRSFFYPSVSTSIVFSEMLNRMNTKPNWLNYGKIRGSYAAVGNDMGPYQLYNYYSIGSDPNGNTTASTNKVLFNPNVKNELIASWEVGIETKLFDNRLGFDLSFYKSNATNQLLNIPLNSMSGRSAKKINAGNIENKGFELMLNIAPIRTEKFNWNINMNLSKNINKVIDLKEDEGVTQYGLGGIENVKILAAAGELYGVIYGSKYARVEDESSPYFGRIIVDADGVPNAADGSHYLGSQQPDAMLGVTNSFTYKNLSFSFLIDARFGGKIFSGTNYGLKQNGRSAETVVNGAREDFIYDGVVADGSGGYVENTKKVSPQIFWTNLSQKSNQNLGITEDNLYDATNIRIRNVQLNYRLPQKWTDAFRAQNAKIGFSMNNVLMLKSHLNGVDPESVFATGSNAVGFEYFSPPTTRSYFFNFSVSF